MELNIGNQIKRLRRERDITQEEFASVLGVSYQSVSRWENNTCYPDIELLPTIADFFGISIDRLMGVDEAAGKSKVAQYTSRFQDAVSQGRIDDCISIARNGVAEYPNNYELLNRLMYVLFLSGDSDGNIPEWQENMQKYDSEITMLGERIMKYCPDQNIRLEAAGRLAFQHCEMGRKELGRAIYETLPSQKYCKEVQMWWALNEDEKLPFVHNRIRAGYSSLCHGIYLLLSERLLPDEELLKICEKQFALDTLVFDGAPPASWRVANTHVMMSAVFARMKKCAQMYAQLEAAATAAKAFDNRTDTVEIPTLLQGKVVQRKTDFETTDSRTLCEIMRDKWLASEDFDGVRDAERFKDILRSLSA